jgi:hypothetical protein
MEPRAHSETSERVVVHLVGGASVTGDLHVPRHTRLLDMLNHQADIRPFCALTNAEWREGGTATKLEFVCLNRANIVAVHPAQA